MSAVFTRIKPNSENMVCEFNSTTVELLCVECGWEGDCGRIAAPWVIFMNHPCRLITESVSKGDF